MRWGTFLSTTVIIVVIIFFQWPKMKGKSKKEQGVFFLLLIICWVLSMFDLANMTGPNDWVTTLFKPFGQFMEQ